MPLAKAQRKKTKDREGGGDPRNASSCFGLMVNILTQGPTDGWKHTPLLTSEVEITVRLQ